MSKIMYQGLRSVHDTTKKEIMDKTLHLISRKFICNYTIESLSKEIGVDKNLISKRFSSVDDILCSIITRAAAVSNESVLGIGNTPLSPKKKLEILTNTMLSGMDANIELAEEFVLMMKMETEDIYSSTVQEYCGAPIFCVAKIIEEGQRRGEFVDGDSTELSKLYWMYVQGIAVICISYGEGFNPPDSKYVYGFLMK